MPRLFTWNPREFCFWATSLCLAFQVNHLAVAHFESRIVLTPSLPTLIGVGASLLLAALAGLVIDWGITNPRWRAVVVALVVWGNALAAGYLYSTHSSLDPSVTLATWDLVFSREALDTVLGSFTSGSSRFVLGVWLVAGAGYAVLAFRQAQHVPPRRGLATLLASLLALVLLLPARGYNEIAGIAWAVAQNAGSSDLELKPGVYPLQRQTPISSTPKEAIRVPVILLMVESFNARFVESQRNGQSVTPVFDGLLQQGVYVERFYGNSVQTSRGQFATLFGLPPVARGKIFTRCRDTRLRGLPQILEQHGYQTAFLQAYQDIEFEGTYDFMRAHGYQVVESAFHQREEDASKVWGWGPEDHLFYRDAFARADALHAEGLQHGGAAKPLFMTLATISNHMRFNVPSHRRTLYPQPQSAEESYLNALHLSDADLAAFIGEIRRRPWLDDALVVITGDHSFPTGQHGVSYNEVGVFEESFRTPLLIWWPGHLAPKRITQIEASQLDIAPSVLDLLGIQVTPNHFMGQSLWSERARQPVPLVQPYNGEYWGAVANKLKYMVRTRTGERLVFDLAQDPEETTNRGDEPQLAASLSPHLETVAALSVVRAALESNAVWPPSDQ